MLPVVVVRSVLFKLIGYRPEGDMHAEDARQRLLSAIPLSQRRLQLAGTTWQHPLRIAQQASAATAGRCT